MWWSGSGSGSGSAKACQGQGTLLQVSPLLLRTPIRWSAGKNETFQWWGGETGDKNPHFTLILFRSSSAIGNVTSGHGGERSTVTWSSLIQRSHSACFRPLQSPPAGRHQETFPFSRSFWWPKHQDDCFHVTDLFLFTLFNGISSFLKQHYRHISHSSIRQICCFASEDFC